MKKFRMIIVPVLVLAFIGLAFAESRITNKFELEILPGKTAASGTSEFYIDYDRFGTSAVTAYQEPRSKGKNQYYQINLSGTSDPASSTPIFGVYTKFSNIDSTNEWSGATSYYIWSSSTVLDTTMPHGVMEDIPGMRYQRWYFVSGASPFNTFEISVTTSD